MAAPPFQDSPAGRSLTLYLAEKSADKALFLCGNVMSSTIVTPSVLTGHYDGYYAVWAR